MSVSQNAVMKAALRCGWQPRVLRMKVRKGVLPAAGLGTRFLPASKSQPKEMLPVVDKPAIQYAAEELVRAGVDDILVITSRGKVSFEDHFDRSIELEHFLEEAGKTDALKEVRSVAEMATFHFVRQSEPLGFGHAVLSAKAHVGDEPFAVAVPDEIVPEPVGDETSLFDQMLAAFREGTSGVICVQRVPGDEISSYGVIEPEGEPAENLVRIKRMVEKPPAPEAPSDLASRGRYVFGPEIFDAIERTPKGVGGEIQLTDAINLLAQERSLMAYVHDGPIWDVGKKLDYLRTTVQVALRRDDLAKPFADFLRGLDLDQSN